MKDRSRAAALCIVFMMTLLALSPSQAPFARANPGSDDPQHVHLTYQHSPTSTITVTWQTAQPSTGDTVLYDSVSWGGDSSKYGLTATGFHHTYVGASGYIHDVELTSLSTDTTYYFICGGPGNYSSERSFRTAPDAARDFTFVFGGDSRTNLVARTQVSQAMRHFNPSFVLHVGDMVDDGTVQSYWDPWFQDLNDNWIGDSGLTIPIIPTLGNHENNATNYYEQFALLGNEQWYYYDWGPTMRIIVLNDEALPSQISGDEVIWLNSVLNSTPAYMRKIVMFHRSVYQSSSAHGPATDLQACWVPVFDKYHVDLVIQGHTHNYARSKPMNNNAPVWSSQIGTVYVTSGGWGAPLADCFDPNSFFVTTSSQYHFVVVNVYENYSMHMEAKDLSGNTFDDFWLHSPLKYWGFQNGMYVRVQDANITQSPILTDQNLTVTITAPAETNSTTQIYCAGRGPPSTVSGVALWQYDTNTNMLTVTTEHTSQSATIVLSWSSESPIDRVPPAAISDLATSSPTNTSITLTWTAPGDNGMSDNATGYIVKYSTNSPITTASWGSAATYSEAWIPVKNGTKETHVVTGLAPDTQYWFAIEAYDKTPNYGGVSNSPSGKTSDLIPPAAITDLATGDPTNSSIMLTWTAPGDNWNVGNGTGYEVKYSTAGPITDSNWASATTYPQSWIPLSAGSNETHVVSGLLANTTYWFAIRAYDEVPNFGGVSNSPSGRTTENTAGAVTPETQTATMTLMYVLAGILVVEAVTTLLAAAIQRRRPNPSPI